MGNVSAGVLLERVGCVSISVSIESYLLNIDIEIYWGEGSFAVDLLM